MLCSPGYVCTPNSIISVRSGIGQQIISFQAKDFWKELQTHPKELNVFALFKNNNTYLM